jgi:hypothetical protein|nr:MAG TPA: hypothetical protein [Caudoviricetes sp.]DAG75467.1 MAG TPA: hypothetical protein [Caudoviricetes sp.]DAJ42923.1 MAG TPA: hypothetical protein [Caudoviricetes sp.]DAL63999.1 MAG TPA_asm: hypothetical protein [Caudoviricetes sp.]DAQ52315.1 MAG TPA: hypothetical protein [Caudoviricetes sp.]
MIKMTLSQPEIKMKIAPAKVVYTGDSKPYEGVYDVTPQAKSAVILPTKDRLLSRDVNVKKIPYYETSNQTGVTVYIASEV